MAEQRVKSKKVDLDEDQVKRFFEGRGSHINEDAPITSVLYQDNNPELALSRDKAEKDKILPKLNTTFPFSGNSSNKSSKISLIFKYSDIFSVSYKPDEMPSQILSKQEKSTEYNTKEHNRL